MALEQRLIYAGSRLVVVQINGIGQFNGRNNWIQAVTLIS